MSFVYKIGNNMVTIWYRFTSLYYDGNWWIKCKVWYGGIL